MYQSGLFAEPPKFDRDGLAARLARLREQNIFIGTSSWKYEGWLDQIYTPERYVTRGKFSKARFESECLAEYAQVFPIVCGDFSFYQFPTPEYWQKLFASASPDLHFAFKIPEEITVNVWPHHARYGPRAGFRNESFLNAALLEAAFLDLLKPYRARVPVLIFEFGAFAQKSFAHAGEFLHALKPFLAALPDTFRYGVEVRNEDYLVPAYFDALRERNITHVFNAWSRMPEIGEQIEMPGAFTSDIVVSRALLKKGRAYEDAVAQFSPYREVQDPNDSARAALRALIQRAQKERRSAYLFVNNRLEGNSPGTIEAVLGDD
ncbi:MAG: DUF72 domain-containing protein [Bryobacteraceae bacterium]